MSGVGNPLNGQNVNYVAVARLADRCVVATPHGATSPQSGVRSVLDPAQMRTVDANKHYTLETSGVAWHLEQMEPQDLRRDHTPSYPEARRRLLRT